MTVEDIEATVPILARSIFHYCNLWTNYTMPLGYSKHHPPCFISIIVGVHQPNNFHRFLFAVHGTPAVLL